MSTSQKSAKVNPCTEEMLPVAKKTKQVTTFGLTAALDYTKTGDRNATYLIAETI